MLPCYTCTYRDRDFTSSAGSIRCKAMLNPERPVHPNNDLDCPLGKGVTEMKITRRRK